MPWELISALTVIYPRCGGADVVSAGGVVAQCRRTDHVATAAAIPNAKELPEGGVRPAEFQSIKADQMSPKLPH